MSLSGKRSGCTYVCGADALEALCCSTGLTHRNARPGLLGGHGDIVLGGPDMLPPQRLRTPQCSNTLPAHGLEYILEIVCQRLERSSFSQDLFYILVMMSRPG